TLPPWVASLSRLGNRSERADAASDRARGRAARGPLAGPVPVGRSVPFVIVPAPAIRGANREAAAGPGCRPGGRANAGPLRTLQSTRAEDWSRAVQSPFGAEPGDSPRGGR